MATTTQTESGTWSIDPAHSNAEFAVKHMMVSTVKGRFRTLEGTITFDPVSQENSRVTATIDASSVDTAQADRDAHLRSEDFFDVERFPKITFGSKKIEQIDENKWKVTGDLTIRGVTKEVVLDTDYEGQIVDTFGRRIAAFNAATAINRKDFGLTWNQIIEAGGFAVGDKVRINLNVEAVRQE